MSFLAARAARLSAWLIQVRTDERGQTFTEYAIIVGAITLGVLLGVGTLRDAIIGALTKAAGDI
jgi:Flp pilus assembly pilin Flp